ncbi:MAG: T9SS type A sorting domain-containing protein [Leadbetterella sp.]
MKNRLFLLAFLSLLVSPICGQKKIISEWSKLYGGKFDEFAMSSVQTADGGLLVVGSTNSKSSGDVGVTYAKEGTGGKDFWVAKLSGAGVLEWTKSFGGSLDDIATSVTRIGTTNDYFVVGTTMSTDFDARLNGSNGGLLMVKISDKGVVASIIVEAGGSLSNGYTYNAPLTYTKPVAKSLSDGRILVGCTRMLNRGPKKQEFNLRIYNANLSLAFAQEYGGNQEDYLSDVVVCSDGGYLMVGNTFSFGNEISGAGNGSIDMYVVKTNATGVIQWQKGFGGESADLLNGAMESSIANQYFLIGETTSSTKGPFGKALGPDKDKDAVLMRIDNTGSILKVNRFGGEEDDAFFGVSSDKKGNMLICGSTASTIGDLEPKLQSDGWIINLKESSYEVNYQLLMGGTDIEQFRGLFVPSVNSNQVYLFGNTFSVDGDVTANKGNADFWVSKLVPPPPVLFGKSEVFKNINDEVEVIWTTTQEVNVNKFIVERSFDNKTFTKIGEYNATGNSTRSVQYKHKDLGFRLGNNFYKITYTDKSNTAFSGLLLTFKYAPLSTNPISSTQKAIVYPNPSNGIFELSTPEELLDMRMYTTDGRQIEFKLDRLDSNKAKISMNVSGNFILEFSTPSHTQTQKVSINR